MEKRYRVNIKQTSKKLHYLDVTVEISGENASFDDIDVLELLKKTEEKLIEDGRKLVDES